MGQVRGLPIPGLQILQHPQIVLASSGIKVAMTPVRVVCQNTLNLALNTAKRVWTTKHTENVMGRIHEAKETLLLAERYMEELGRSIDALSKISLSDRKVTEFMEELFPVNDCRHRNHLLMQQPAPSCTPCR